MLRTVEKRIVGQEKSATNHDSSSKASEGFLGRPAAATTVSLRAAGDFGGEALPCFSGVGGRHFGGRMSGVGWDGADGDVWSVVRSTKRMAAKVSSGVQG